MSTEAATLKWSDLQSVFAAESNAGDDGVDSHVDVFCFNCRQNGHSESHCTQPRRCFICFKTTHQGYQCVDNPVPGSIEYKQDARCSLCAERGHTEFQCKSPGGPMHMRAGGIRQAVDTVFPKPLVLHVARDSGPSEKELQRARSDVLSVLRRMHHPILPSVDGRTHPVRDVEFFSAVLPLLKDDSFTAQDRDVIKASLLRMRAAVAGSISLGSLKRKAGAPTRREDVDSHGDLWYDMRSSGLDINVVLGGRLDVFRRLKHTAASAVSSHAEGSDVVNLLDKKVVTAGYVYLQSACCEQVTKNGGPQNRPQSSSLKTDASDGLASAMKDSKVEQALTSVGISSQHKSPPANTSPRYAAQQSPLPNSSAGASAERPLAALSIFTAPVAPHLRPEEDITRDVISEWMSADAPSTATPSHTQATSLMTASSGIVRQYLNSAKLRNASATELWKHSSHISSARHRSRPPTTQDQSNSPAVSEPPIKNWNWHHRQVTEATVTLSCPSALPERSNSVTSTVPVDVVQQWRMRFEQSKVRDAQRVRTTLSERAVHRKIVAQDKSKIDSLADQWLTASQAKSGARSAIPHPPSGRRNGGNLWSETCHHIAVDAARQQLRTAAAAEVRDYASRVGLVESSPGVVEEICEALMRASNGADFDQRCGSMITREQSQATVPSLAAVKKVVQLASSLLLAMEGDAGRDARVS